MSIIRIKWSRTLDSSYFEMPWNQMRCFLVHVVQKIRELWIDKKGVPWISENIKMMDITANPILQHTKKFDKDPKEAKIAKLCKQVENLHLMMMRQPRKAPKKAESVHCKWGKKGHYTSPCRTEQESTCCRCDKKGHRASECRSKVDILPTYTFFHRDVHTAENCFVKRSNETVEKQDVMFAKNSEPTESKASEPSGQNNIMFVESGDPVEE